jgi:predicted nucleic acid-binding protein
VFALDANVAIYAFVEDHRADRAEALLAQSPRLSVQVLNEFSAVARRKLGFDWQKLDRAIIRLCDLSDSIIELTPAINAQGRRIAERYKLGIYDALIIAAALEAGCDTLYSEDMQDGLVIDDRLAIRNPFAGLT